MVRGILFSLVIVVALVALACAEATPTPTPRPTATPVPTATPTATATPVPGVPTATPTPTPRPTPTATATPTATPVPKGYLGPGTKVVLDFIYSDTTSQMQYKATEQFVKDTLDKRTGGRVQFKGISRAELGIDQFAALRVFQQGVIDLSKISVGEISGDYPPATGVDLAGLFTDRSGLKQGLDSFFPLATPDLERLFKAKPLNKWWMGPQVHWCKGQVTGMLDIKGKRVRAWSTTLSDFVSALGGTSVSIAFAEVYTALERGVVDCALTSTLSGRDERWYEVTNSMYTLPLTWAVGFHAINTDAWAGLPADVQKWLGEYLEELSQDVWWKVGEEGIQDGINCAAGREPCTTPLKKAASGKGLTIYEFKPADLSLLKQVFEGAVLPGWVKSCGKAKDWNEQKCANAFNSTVGKQAGYTAKTSS